MVAGRFRGLQIPHKQGVFRSLDCPILARNCAWVRVKLGSSILDSYSHWMPSIAHNTAEGIDEALG